MAAATQLTASEVRQLARTGATIRLNALQEEESSLLKIFPELRDEKKTATARQGRRGGWHMSNKQKKAVSLRMKKYWAERRRQKAKGGRAAKAN